MEKRWEKRTGTSKWNLWGRWDNATMHEMLHKCVWREINQERNLTQKHCNGYHQLCGAGDVTVVVMVCCNCWIFLSLLPVPCQQHGGVLTEVLGAFGKWKLWGRNDNGEWFFIYLLSTSFSLIWQDLDYSEWTFDSRILWLGNCSDKNIEFLCQIKDPMLDFGVSRHCFYHIHSHVCEKKKASKR